MTTLRLSSRNVDGSRAHASAASSSMSPSPGACLRPPVLAARHRWPRRTCLVHRHSRRRRRPPGVPIRLPARRRPTPGARRPRPAERTRRARRFAAQRQSAAGRRVSSLPSPNSREACTRDGTAPSLATGSIRRGSRPGSAGAVTKKKARTVRGPTAAQRRRQPKQADVMGLQVLDRVRRNGSGPAPSGNRGDNSPGDHDVKDGLHGRTIAAGG